MKNRLKIGVLYFLALLMAGPVAWAQQSPPTPKLNAIVALRLPPGVNNPRNSEGDFVTLKDGRILFVFTHFTGNSPGDHAPAYLAGRYSSDGGNTWTRDDVVMVPNKAGLNIMSVSLLRLHDGRIALFYLRKASTNDCLPVARFSIDEAKTWSDEVDCITDKTGYFVLNNNRVIQLKTGRLVMAVAKHTNTGGGFQSKGALYCYYSDDGGTTWMPGKQVPDTTDIVTQEPGLIELRNGSVMMFIRASGGVQYFSYSQDGGISWRHILPGNIASPLSPASMARIPGTGDIVLVWNNNDGADVSIKNKRTPLTIAISKDEGKTWVHVQNLEDAKQGWYCYTALHFTENHLLLGYCTGNQFNGGHLNSSDISLVPIKALYEEN